MDAFKKLLDFYKADAIKDPVALATYVTRRYGTMDKFAMARGMVGKLNAKKWNPVKNTPTGGKKSGKKAGTTVQGTLPGAKPEKKVETDVPARENYKGKKGDTSRAMTGGGYYKGGRGGKTRSSKKSLDIDKAQSIEDTRQLAHHLASADKNPKSKSGGSKSLWHAGRAGAETGDRSWSDYEGGIRSKDRAKECNKVVGPPGSR